MSCLDTINNLSRDVSATNTELTINMTEENVRYKDACIKPNITFDFYYNSLKAKWEKTVNTYINNPEKCTSGVNNILLLLEVMSKLDSKANSLESVVGKLGSMTTPEITKLVHDRIIDEALDIIRSPDTANNFVVDTDFIKTLKNLSLLLGENCQCQMMDIFSFVLDRYRHRYSQKLAGLNREESINVIKQDYEYVKNVVKVFGKFFEAKSDKIDKSAFSFNFSLEAELNKLIPDDLGSMKDFFIKIILRYFNNLHPIIWVQIYKAIIDNIFVDLPITPGEFFSFVSKYMLLNSGPFILKIIQMIRPILSDELASKYNLTKLSYPLLESNQVDLILRRSVVDYEMIRIIYNKSASVGHVCIGYDVRHPNDKFVIKIIKPLAIAQSCWEYSVLHDLFEKDSCEDRFIKTTLRANGKEMNVVNEIINLEKGNSNYTTDYNTEFALDIDAKLTTVSHKEGIIKDGVWYALAMSLAPGIPLADLVEMNLLQNDTKFRAHLHRCLDLLVVKFFYVLISQGFYHGDLHAGNVFYSFKNRQLTMIDFGAMGEIDLFANDATTSNLLIILIMSINYDYDGIFDLLTDILNSRCTEQSTFIDKNSPEYQTLKTELVAHKIKNTMNADKERKIATQYLDDLDSDKRLDDERLETLADLKKDSEVEDRDPSIYDDFDRVPETKETVVENTDVLPVFTEILGESESITFAGVMSLIIVFYAKIGVNVAVKFAELNELQKAYSLLLGVLTKTGYNSYRMGMAIKSGVLTWGHLPKLLNVSTTYTVLSSYWNESSKYKMLMETIEKEKEAYMKARELRALRRANARLLGKTN